APDRIVAMDGLSGSQRALQDAMARQGYAFLSGEEMQPLLARVGSLADWDAFAASWGGMPVDTYMADGGRYRRRRPAAFAAAPGAAIIRQPHQPHYQSVEYNTLHGGIERWFEAVPDRVADGASASTILEFCRALFERLEGARRTW